jgi:ribosomal protein S18 acetylase RimI-like enzyme
LFFITMNTEAIHISRAEAEHAEIITDLAKRTFIETYAELSNADNLQLYVSQHFTLEKIAAELADPACRFYLAWKDEQLAGFVIIRKDRQPKGIIGQKTLEIQRIYVLQEFQGFSVGKELIRLVREIAKAEHDQIIWLQVWQKNDKAIQFYRKAGFVVYETASFEFGNEIHQDFMLRFDLYN